MDKPSDDALNEELAESAARLRAAIVTSFEDGALVEEIADLTGLSVADVEQILRG